MSARNVAPASSNPGTTDVPSRRIPIDARPVGAVGLVARDEVADREVHAVAERLAAHEHPPRVFEGAEQTLVEEPSR